jgi:hydroxymethylglutaryl-CoA lyase
MLNSAYFETKNDAKRMQTLHRLMAVAPKSSTFKQLASAYEVESAKDPVVMINVYRLGAQKGLLSGEHYAKYAETALDPLEPRRGAFDAREGHGLGRDQEGRPQQPPAPGREVPGRPPEGDRVPAGEGSARHEDRRTGGKARDGILHAEELPESVERPRSARSRRATSSAPDDVNMVLGISLANSKKSADAKKAFAAAQPRTARREASRISGPASSASRGRRGSIGAAARNRRGPLRIQSGKCAKSRSIEIVRGRAARRPAERVGDRSRPASRSNSSAAPIEAGIRRIEVASFVSPGRVPQTGGRGGDPEGAYRARDDVYLRRARPESAPASIRRRRRGCREIGMVVFHHRTEFNRRNQGVPSADSIRTLARDPLRPDARRAGIRAQVTISGRFRAALRGRGPRPARRRHRARARPKAATFEIAIATRSASECSRPGDRDLRRRVAASAPGIALRGHFHNTRNTGLANAYAAMTAGARVLDASLGGLGGCPFAPAATGNIPTEDLVYMLGRMGIDTGIDLERAIETARWVEPHVGHAGAGHARQGRWIPRRAPRAGLVSINGRKTTMTIKAGDRIPDGKLKVMGADGPVNVTAAELLGKGRVVLFSCRALHATCDARHPAGLRREGRGASRHGRRQDRPAWRSMTSLS